MKINTADITIDYDINIRTEIDQDTVDRYAELNLEGFPPIVVFDTPEQTHLLVDGFHRLGAAEKLELKEIEAEIRGGTRIDAEAYALTANAKTGKPLTRSERKVAALRMLKLYPERANQWIAEDIGVDKNSIKKYREDLDASGWEFHTLEKLIGKDGKEYPRTIKQPSWRDDASEILLRCIDTNIFSKNVAKALVKFTLEVQDTIAGQIEVMNDRPPSSIILDWIYKLDNLDGDLPEAFWNGSFRFMYFDDIYKLWDAGERRAKEKDASAEFAIEDAPLLSELRGSPNRQYVAFDHRVKETYCVTPHNCIIPSSSDYELTKKYHPVMRMMEGASLVSGCTPPVYRVCFRQPFLNDEAIYSALKDEGFHINRDQDYMLSAVIEGKDSLRVQSPENWDISTAELVHPIISGIKALCTEYNFEISMEDKTATRCTWNLTSTPALFADEAAVWKLEELLGFDFEIVENAFEEPGDKETLALALNEMEQATLEILPEGEKDSTPQAQETVSSSLREEKLSGTVPAKWETYGEYYQWIEDYSFSLLKENPQYARKAHRTLATLAGNLYVALSELGHNNDN